MNWRMYLIWNKLIDLSEKIENIFDENFKRYPITEDVNFSGWKDLYWKSDYIRKCHLKTIDNRDTQKMWLMHVNIFPNTNLNLPILGFDIVAGCNKITGAFFDYSPVDKHQFIDYYNTRTQKLTWNKPRVLPDWTKHIFSPNIIAVGNVKSEEEIDQLYSECLHLIDYYVTNSGLHNRTGDYKEQHNYYCKQQKLNPHLHKSILNMGLSEENKNKYINNVLFEEV